MASHSDPAPAERDDISEATVTEETPLVPKSPTSENEGTGLFSSFPPYRTGRLHRPQSPTVLVAILTGGILLASSSSGFLAIPILRVFEDVLCRQYYNVSRHRDGGGIDERMCKADPIQSELAYLFAVMGSFNAGISCLASLPWGIAADRIGRRQVFALAVTGMVVSEIWIIGVGWLSHILPPKLIWVSPVFYLLGGGNPVLAAALQGMVVDVVPESLRAVALVRIHAASNIGNLLSPALASLMMSATGPWPPMILSTLLLAATAPLIFLIPETMKQNAGDGSSDPDPVGFQSRLEQSMLELKNSATIFKSPSMILILVMTMLQLPVLLSTYTFLSLFVSKRYEILLVDTGYIQSVYGIAVSVVSFIILPFLSALVLKPYMPTFLRSTDERHRDLAFARWSLAVMIIGTFVLAISPSLAGFVFGLIVLAFGCGADSYVKTLSTLYVSPDQRSRLFTILGLTMIISDIWASPALAALFSLGMRLSGVWIGLPYFGVFFLCVLMLLLSLFIRLPQLHGSGDSIGSEDDDT